MLRTGTAVVGSAALVGLGLAAWSGSASAADGSPCSTGALPTVVEGNPGVRAGQAVGAYLYHDSSGFHLRVTHPGNKKLVVRARFDATSFSDIKPVSLERADTITETGDGRTLSVRFVNFGRIDGLDFSADCSKRLRVDVSLNGDRATTRQVKLGAHRMSPTSVPLVIERTGSAPRPSGSPSPSATPSASASASPSASHSASPSTTPSKSPSASPSA